MVRFLLGRKLYHLGMGLACFVLYGFILTHKQSLIIVATTLLLSLVVEAVRLTRPQVNTVVVRWAGSLMRASELSQVSGHTYFLLGLLVLLLCFSKAIVLASVLFLAVGDCAASIVGSQYGRHAIVGQKTMEGTAANFLVVALLLGGLLFFGLGWSLQQSLLWSLIGGTASAVSEVVPLPIDDNFSIPVVSASLLWGVDRWFLAAPAL